jgi:hypothetical protein
MSLDLRAAAALVVYLVASFPGQLHAHSIVFADNTHGLTGQASAIIAAGPFVGSLTAGPAGALLNENDDQGLGVDNRPAAGSLADSGATRGVTKLNIIGGSGPLAGSGEYVTFTFDRAGVLKHLFFDGLKDETLEYFKLTLPGGDVMTVFDSQTQAKLNDQGFDLLDLQVTNPVLCQDEEDDLYDLNFRFQAGEVFTITYGEVAYASVLPTYVPVVLELPNGSRFQGFDVVPEPSTLLLVCSAAGAWILRGGRERSDNSLA